MSAIGLLSSFTRLSLSHSRNVSTGSQLLFRVTPSLLAEPLKKKKRIDPQILKNREDRKKKKLEKQIRRLEKNARQLKPIDELEVPLTLIDSRKERERKLPAISPAVAEQRALLQKSWSRYRSKVYLNDLQMYDRIVLSQQKALDELRKESEDLYREAIQIDLALLPFSAKGTVATPPIDNFDSPDGEYIDVSKKWE